MGRGRADHRLVQDQEPSAARSPGPVACSRAHRVNQAERIRLVFPSAKDPSKPVSHGTLYSFVWRQRDRGVIPYATNRDLRRTFKTLAGKAGVPKEIRDRLQNHALQDVSSKNYDRWNYMPEKRAGMARWDKYVRALLKKRKAKAATR